MRANDPDFKPSYTPEQIREGEAAYHASTRDEGLKKKVDSLKAELPTLGAAEVKAKSKANKSGLITAAQTSNHGIKAEALQYLDKIQGRQDRGCGVDAQRNHRDRAA